MNSRSQDRAGRWLRDVAFVARCVALGAAVILLSLGIKALAFGTSDTDVTIAHGMGFALGLILAGFGMGPRR